MSGSTTSTPGAVTLLTAGTPTTSTIPLTWQAPSVGAAPSGYLVETSPANQNAWTTFASGVTATSVTVTGLSPATSYDIRVTPTNSAGNGQPSVLPGTTTAAVPATTPTTDSLYLAPGLVEGSHASEFLVREANGFLSRELATLSNAGTAAVLYPAGLVVAMSGVPGGYTAAPWTSTTASGTHAAILYQPKLVQPGQTIKVTLVARNAEVNLMELHYDASIATQALQSGVVQALAGANVICR